MPIVSSGVPDRETAVNAGVDYQAGHGRACLLGRPSLTLELELRTISCGLSSLADYRVFDGGDRGFWGIGGRVECLLVTAGPSAGKSIPASVEKEGFAETVVASDDIKTLTKLRREVGHRADMMEC